MTAIRTPATSAPPPDSPAATPPVPVDIEGVRALLDGLDRRQREAVTHGEGPLLVVAGPGTGKTEVITRRVAWLIASRRARPAQVLALTFTERAADEMQARIDVLVPYGQADTAVHTFHAFGDLLIREHGHEIGLPAEPRVIGRAAAVALLRDHVFELGLDRYLPLGDPTRFVGSLADLFGRAKEEGIRPDDLADYANSLAAGARAAVDEAADAPTREAVAGLLDEAEAQAELARAFAAYQQLLVERSLIDHGDQVAEAVRLLDERPSVRMHLRRRFRYVVVDEAQDANPQQLRLVERLAGPSGNITFVGDDDQAIYSFRGAVGQGLAELDSTYVGLKDVVLRRNYRSRKPILDAARRLIRHNDPDRLEVQRGLDKTLTAVRRARRPVMVRHAVYGTATQEADGIAADILHRIEAGMAPSELAVLTRTNADAGPVLASLGALGVPTRFSGASGLLRHREVNELLSLLAVLASPSSSADLYALMAAAPFGLGGEDLTAICELASRRHRSLWSIVCDCVEQPGLLRLSRATRTSLERLVTQLKAAIADAHDRAAPAVLYGFLRDSGWLRSLVADAERGDDGPLRRAARLFEIVKEQSDLTSDDRVTVVAPALRALIEAGHDPAAPEPDPSGDSVSVLTVHQAKGLEFSVVFVLGAAEGRFPIRARRAPLSLPPALTGEAHGNVAEAHLAEERRLFYVAMTRARDELVLSHAAAGQRGGRHRRPSVFLSEALGRPIADAVPDEAASALDRPVPVGQLPASASAPARAPLTLSFSQVDDYLTCPLKYRLRHVVRVPAPASHSLVLGNALHQAVAVVNKARMRDEPIDAETVMSTLAAHWQSEGFLSQAHEEARYEAGTTALARFIERSGTGSDEILAAERPFSVRIGEDRIRGRYDAVRRVGTDVIITDYKSGDTRDPERARQRARSSLQLQLYALAWEAEHGTAPDAVELHFLEGDVAASARPTARQLDRARQQVARAADGIRAGRFEATPGYPACDWCPYRRVCPAAP